MRKEAISNDSIASAFTNRLLKSQGLNPTEAPKVFGQAKDILNHVDMSKNMLPPGMLEDKAVNKLIGQGKRDALKELSKSYVKSNIPVKLSRPFFKNWKILLPSAIGASLAAGGLYYHQIKKEEEKKKMKKEASIQRIIGLSLRGYRIGLADAKKEFEKEFKKKGKGFKSRLNKLIKGRSYEKRLTKKAGGPGSGTKKDNTLPITDLKQSDVIRIGGRKAIIDTQPYEEQIILVSKIKYAAQDNYVPEKLNQIVKAMSKPDWEDKPIDVMEVSGEYHVLDGHHRALAAIKLHRKKIPAKVYKGSKKQAFLEGFSKRAKKEIAVDNRRLDRGDVGTSVADDTIPSGVGEPSTRRSTIIETITRDRILDEREPRSYTSPLAPYSANLQTLFEDPATKVVY